MSKSRVIRWSMVALAAAFSFAFSFAPNASIGTASTGPASYMSAPHSPHAAPNAAIGTA